MGLPENHQSDSGVSEVDFDLRAVQDAIPALSNSSDPEASNVAPFAADPAQRMDVTATERMSNSSCLDMSSGPGQHNDIASSIMQLFAHRGVTLPERSLLDAAVSTCYEAHSEPLKQSDILSALGAAYDDRYDQLARLEDMNMAIECWNQALLLVDDGNPGKPELLTRTGVAYRCRFEHLGQPADLEVSIDMIMQAVLMTPEEDPNKPRWLTQLGNSYTSVFGHQGDIEALDVAVDCHEQAVSLTPDGSPKKPGLLSNLSGAYIGRFECLGESTDVDNAIGYLRQAVAIAPEDSTFLNNLGTASYIRFKHQGKLSDLETAITCQTKATSIAPVGSPDQALCQNGLGNSYQAMFENSGKLADLDRAITCLRAAVSLTPDSHVTRFTRLSNFANSLLRRFHRLEMIRDLEQAIECHQEAESLAPEGHPRRPGILHNLSAAYDTRFMALNDSADLDRAIEYQTQAISLTDSEDPNKPNFLNNLGGYYGEKFKHSDDLSSLALAVKYHAQAVSLIPDEHPNKPIWLGNLGTSHFTQFERLKDRDDIDKAIQYRREGISLLPKGHSHKSELQSILGESYSTRYEAYGDPVDIEQAVECFERGALLPTGDPLTRLNASRRWARLSLTNQISSPLDAYREVMKLLFQVVWLGSSVIHRYQYISTIASDLTMEAVAAAIELDAYGLALEWAEEGRSIVWQQMLQLRGRFDKLDMLDISLAEKVKQVAHALGEMSSLGPVEAVDLASDFPSLELEAQQHRRLAEKWEELLDSVRSIPGMESFLRPRKSSELLAAMDTGAIVLINVYHVRSDALVMLPCSKSVDCVALPNFSYDKAARAQSKLALSLRAQGRTGRGIFVHKAKQTDHVFQEVLAMLWADVVKPVLEHLGYIQTLPKDELPHITWCTTGPLSFLPLHAAGVYAKDGCSLSQYAVSSYTPTISALLDGAPAPTAPPNILAVGQTSTLGFSPLPGTAAELDALGQRAGDLLRVRLDGNKATCSSVLEAMRSNNWVHFACHASQNILEPTKSAFHLHDGPLNLAVITQKPLDNASLAFLSACQTATGDKTLSDEAVHLAAGMMMAGYRTVVATMWSINDNDAPLVAERFYAYMLEGGTSGKDAAKALHNAIGFLRNKVGVREFARWVPYIHIGR
ncbi:hypothetical protein FRC08_000689 [Ceratobasidium sp. 394]|nr:hypothetical protein FRC08_000689 [Ceratobasidium sp. 394]